ncbi:MAG: DUF1320 domain-containing protein [Ignavibacteriaceae bacterium]|nr:DUF1320 domain-containing protein [Ignavibacteriaceae bacterium]
MQINVADITRFIAEDELIQLLNDENALADEVDLTDEATAAGERLSYLILSAGEEVESYLRGIYALPLANTPQLLKDLCSRLVIYYCFLRRVSEVPADRETSYKDALKQLAEIRKGNIVLDLAKAETDSAITGGITISAPARKFTDNDLEAW